ncbi:hypothetical protein GGX14DRAFT_579464 [Mycena pura]|uniref:Uncharacterized protein n=1 Tax=Mycena pura TaxID=153505 RepID=A0AAD6UMY6_9AGAR|nr:hypothetical protein GGX14DRAFT_579464 [Mycena pura]
MPARCAPAACWRVAVLSRPGAARHSVRSRSDICGRSRQRPACVRDAASHGPYTGILKIGLSPCSHRRRTQIEIHGPHRLPPAAPPRPPPAPPSAPPPAPPPARRACCPPPAARRPPPAAPPARCLFYSAALQPRLPVALLHPLPHLPTTYTLPSLPAAPSQGDCVRPLPAHRMHAPAGRASPLFAITSLNSMDSGHQEVMPISTPDLHARRLSSSNAWAAPLSRTDSCHLPLLSAERIYNTLNILYYTA